MGRIYKISILLVSVVNMCDMYMSNKNKIDYLYQNHNQHHIEIDWNNI